MKKSPTNLKQSVLEHWERETCGTRYGESAERKKWLEEIAQARYSLEPHIQTFADFQGGKGKKVLEIGVGAGVDFLNWIKNGAEATGVDLTQAAVKLTRERLETHGVSPDQYKLFVTDAENLPFSEHQFDIVYSWGVLHHTPDTERALRECFRILKPGGALKIMMYHLPSWTGWMMWAQSCLLRGKLYRSPRQAIFHRLESPGTKVYTNTQAKKLLEKIGFQSIHLETKLCAGDLLKIQPSQKYQSRLYRMLWKFYPRWLVKTLGNRFGLELLIEAKK